MEFKLKLYFKKLTFIIEYFYKELFNVKYLCFQK